MDLQNWKQRVIDLYKKLREFMTPRNLEIIATGGAGVDPGLCSADFQHGDMIPVFTFN